MKEDRSIPFDSKPITAYFSAPDGTGPYPGLIVIEEIWGLNEHIRDVCDRFAKEGFAVLSPELLDESGVLEKMNLDVFKQMQSDDEKVQHEAQAKMREAMTPINTEEFAKQTIAKLTACVDYLLRDERVNGNVGVLGFCFGGCYAFHLAVNDGRVKALVKAFVIFYGSSPSLDDIASIKAPVLAFYGEEDKRLIENLPALEAAMKRESKDFSYMRYPRTGHAFFNDTRPNAYNEDAARDAWEKSLAFLHKHLDAQSP